MVYSTFFPFLHVPKDSGILHSFLILLVYELTLLLLSLFHFDLYIFFTYPLHNLLRTFYTAALLLRGPLVLPAILVCLRRGSVRPR